MARGKKKDPAQAAPTPEITAPTPEVQEAPETIPAQPEPEVHKPAVEDDDWKILEDIFSKKRR